MNIKAEVPSKLPTVSTTFKTFPFYNFSALSSPIEIRSITSSTHIQLALRKSSTMVKLLAISVLVASALAHPHVVSTADSLSVRAAAVSNNPIVNLGYVSYRGITNTTSGITYYRGIPYALPPLGALRWRKPVPVDPLNLPVGPLMNATVIKPACFLSIPVSLAGISLPGYTVSSA